MNLDRKQGLKFLSAKSQQESEGAAAADEPRLIEEGRGFMCGELVLKAFKLCGIIETDEACSNWLPARMTSEANDMPLVQGATLGPEQLLITETMLSRH